MYGLDTRGAFDGFVQGFQLMDNYQARQAAQRNADQQMAMQQQGLDMRAQELQSNRDLAERRFGLDEQQMGLQQQRFEQQMTMDERRMQQIDRQFERQAAMDNRRFGLQEREMGLRLRERNEQRDMQILRAGYAKIAEGHELGDDELAVFKRYPWLAPSHVADPRMDAAVARAVKVLDPNDPADANDPESLEAINYMFGPNIQRGDGGRKRIAAVYPGQTPGTLAFELEVTRDDGQTYNAPMTRNRSTADDDEVLQVPIEAVVQRAAAYKTLNGLLRHSGNRERAVALGQRLGLVDQFDRKGVPADVQAAQWLVGSGAAPDVQTAWSMVRGARGKSRQDFALDYAKMITQGQDPLLSADQQVSAEAAFQAGLQMYDRLNSGEQQSSPGQTVPQQDTASASGEQNPDSEIRALGLW